MQYVFNVEYKRNVNVTGDYSIVNYTAEYLGESELPRERYSGTIRIAPHDADPDKEIGRDILGQIQRLTLPESEVATVTVEQ